MEIVIININSTNMIMIISKITLLKMLWEHIDQKVLIWD